MGSLCRLNLGYIDGLVQDCCNSSALAMELLQSCTKPSMGWIMLNKIQTSEWHKNDF